MSYALGLDLGTTYTAAAIARDGRAEVFPLGNRAAVVPSVVHLGDDGTVVAGEGAQRRVATDPSRVAREFKRRFGDPTPLLLAGTPIAPEALTARLARAVVDLVVEREGTAPDRITVTHPATWGPFKRDLLDQAMRQADLQHVALLSEPEAAAWEYASTRALAPGATIAVYDLGGGTFDATVLRATPTGFELLGEPEGIERLGGIDIDQAVFAFVVQALDGAVEALDPDDPVAVTALARLRADCVEAKEALSSDNEAAVPVVLPTVQTEVRITRPELEALVRPTLSDTVAALGRALRSAGVTPEQLDAVLLVGGSSRIPLVGELVGDLLGRPVAVDAHPKHLVALGAARHAESGGVLPGPRSAPAPTLAPTVPSPVAVPPAPVAPDPTRVAPGAAPVASDAAPPPPPAVAPPPAPSPMAPPLSPTVDRASAPGRAAASGPRPAGSSGPRWGLIAGIAALVVVLVAVVAGLALAGGGGGGGDDETADGDGAQVDGDGAPAPDCDAAGPFVCIVDVDRPAGGEAVVGFVPVGFDVPADATLVFFLADVVTSDQGLTAVQAGAPLEWSSSDDFHGWAPDEMAGRAAVCALVVDGGQVLTGSGNCRALP